jgi:hypothetical protein
MMLTPAQQAALKAFIEADPVFSLYPHNYDGAYDLAVALQALAEPAFQVWKTDAMVSDIYDAITWANFTPANPSAGSGSDVTNWLLACQGKQFNLQTLLSGRDTLNAAKPNIRSGLQDATTSIPSGVAGATKAGGWTNIQLVIQRPANILEKLFATGTGSQASPATMAIEGSINHTDLHTAMGW